MTNSISNHKFHLTFQNKVLPIYLHYNHPFPAVKHLKCFTFFQIHRFIPANLSQHCKLPRNLFLQLCVVVTVWPKAPWVSLALLTTHQHSVFTMWPPFHQRNQIVWAIVIVLQKWDAQFPIAISTYLHSDHLTVAHTDKQGPEHPWGIAPHLTSGRKQPNWLNIGFSNFK